MSYLGYSVLELKPNAAAQREAVWSRNMFRLDPKVGRVAVRDRAGFPIVGHRGFGWVLDGRQEIEDFRVWLAARRGRLIPFWFPTWRRDLVLAAPVSATATVLPIVRSGYTQHQFPFEARRHLYIHSRLPAIGWGEGAWGDSPWGGAGASSFHRVISTVENPTTEDLTLDSPVGEDLPTNALISFLTLCRLSADDVEIIWHTSNLATVIADFTELPHEAPTFITLGPGDGQLAANDAAVGTTPWASPGFALTPDDVHAEVTLSGFEISQYLRVTGIQFPTPVPANATILGLQAEVRKHGDGTINDAFARFFKAGAPTGNNIANSSSWPSLPAYFTYGGPTDLSGGSFTAAEINDPGFGFGISAQNYLNPSGGIAARVDHARLTVYYYA